MSKVTVGFKCQPELKQELLQEAVQSGITISEYVESLCANRNHQIIPYATDKHLLAGTSQELEALRARLYEYEQVLLGPWFQQYQGKTLQIEEGGKTIDLVITDPTELLEVILSALKSQHG